MFVIVDSNLTMYGKGQVVGLEPDGRCYKSVKSISSAFSGLTPTCAYRKALPYIKKCKSHRKDIKHVSDKFPVFVLKLFWLRFKLCMLDKAPR